MVIIDATLTVLTTGPHLTPVIIYPITSTHYHQTNVRRRFLPLGGPSPWVSVSAAMTLMGHVDPDQWSTFMTDTYDDLHITSKSGYRIVLTDPCAGGPEHKSVSTLQDPRCKSISITVVDDLVIDSDCRGEILRSTRIESNCQSIRGARIAIRDAGHMQKTSSNPSPSPSMEHVQYRQREALHCDGWSNLMDSSPIPQ
ncbi:hypothetical protein BGZ60DRAFT_570460 [Tricladium varicosporioides]|nr:hypothetical protein BGZ60DRAFT_570460 [Hymenoscyphus varicosporioides]